MDGTGLNVEGEMMMALSFSWCNWRVTPAFRPCQQSEEFSREGHRCGNSSLKGKPVNKKGWEWCMLQRGKEGDP